MKLNEIIDTDMLANELHAGYVTERFHPEFPELAILNYTDRCQFDQHWTDVTRRTRGLIYNRETSEIVARPFAKFYNYGDTTNTGDLSPDAPILSAHNKWDGSLGIRYRQPDGRYAIATRGSFTSDQAIHATSLLHAQPEGLPIPIDGQTDLFEIIFPGNRIVLDYGDMDALMFLGAVEHASGDFYPVRRRDEPNAKTLREIIELPSRENAEGWVVWLDPQRAVKFKQEDYLALHRIVSSLSTKEVWRQLRAGTFEEFAVSLPDEFHQWALETAEPLLAQHSWTVAGAHAWVAAVHARDPPGRTRAGVLPARWEGHHRRRLADGRTDGRRHVRAR
jgi:RNA ligase